MSDALLTNKQCWPATLADRTGVWCAYCLNYFPVKGELLEHNLLSLEQHHPLPQSSFKLFGKPSLPKGFSIGWTIPVHRECHKQLHEEGASVGAALRRVLRMSLDVRGRLGASVARIRRVLARHDRERAHSRHGPRPSSPANAES